ncbi:MAG TPA: GNAT family N-acetyltransferase [Conexibacter sp.]|nr:GNAT family N-acetyltransferase [Conexibacter sp.]
MAELEVELVSELEALDALAPEWDELAVAARQPMTAPAWMLTLWRHLRAPEEQARVVAVRERGRLVGLAPLAAGVGLPGRVEYRLMVPEIPRTSPLALPGREWEVGAAIAGALDRAQPRPDVVLLESAPLDTCWPLALAAGWPGRLRPPLRQYAVVGSPVVSLGDASFDAWLARRSSNFRGQMRRARRQFEAAGGVSRASTQASLHDDLATFMRLHADRWEGRGDSPIVALGERLAAAFEAVGRLLLDSGRFRLRLLELEGEAISAQLFGEAGGEVLYYNGGWDERFARFKPAQLSIFDAIEECFERGDARMDLGPGQQPYKLRFADGDDPVAWNVLAVPGRRLPLTLARTLPEIGSRELRAAAKRALSGAQADRLRELRGRLRR